jgi:hypothetical protein
MENVNVPADVTVKGPEVCVFCALVAGHARAVLNSFDAVENDPVPAINTFELGGPVLLRRHA